MDSRIGISLKRVIVDSARSPKKSSIFSLMGRKEGQVYRSPVPPIFCTAWARAPGRASRRAVFHAENSRMISRLALRIAEGTASGSVASQALASGGGKEQAAHLETEVPYWEKSINKLRWPLNVAGLLDREGKGNLGLANAGSLRLRENVLNEIG